MFDITKDRITLKKDKEKQKMRISQTKTIIFFKTFAFFVGKHIWKNLVYFVTFVLQIFRMAGYWKNTIIKHQSPYRYALVFYTQYFDSKYLAIDWVF